MKKRTPAKAPNQYAALLLDVTRAFFRIALTVLGIYGLLLAIRYGLF